MNLTVRAPIVIFKDEDHLRVHEMLPNWLIEKDLEIPFTTIPSELALIVGPYPVLFFVSGSRFEEKTNRLIVFAETLEWHDKSFARTIASIKMGENGWRVSKA